VRRAAAGAEITWKDPGNVSAPLPLIAERHERALVLDVTDLETHFEAAGSVAKAVDRTSFQVREGETVCVVGESGSGKSVTALSILQLVASPPGRIVGGRAMFGGRDLLTLSERDMRRIRGNEISMIFQEPMTSLNPVLSIGYQINEVLRRHQGLTKKQARRRAVEMLGLVQIPEPERRAREFPHQLSGGMRQRVMIAMALSCNPKLLIADEPTTALDVTIQAQILDLIRELQARLNTSVIFITHNLGIVAQIAHHVVVMYAGRKVEEGPVEALFSQPRHPYTWGLLNSVPRLGASTEEQASEDLAEIPGIVPSLTALPPGCTFAPRCPLAEDRCRREAPPYRVLGVGHVSACWNADRAMEASW
jgi:peptide/nickel transport system ATP-binding protein